MGLQHVLLVSALISRASGVDFTVAEGATDDLPAGSYTYDHVQVSALLVGERRGRRVEGSCGLRRSARG